MRICNITNYFELKGFIVVVFNIYVIQVNHFGGILNIIFLHKCFFSYALGQVKEHWSVNKSLFKVTFLYRKLSIEHPNGVGHHLHNVKSKCNQ